MIRAVWDGLLIELRKAHGASATLGTFCAFPTDVAAQDVLPFHVPSADLFSAERGLFAEQYAGLRDALVAAAPLAHWRETYKHTAIGQDFMDRFGCYCLIGEDGAFESRAIRAWMVYMPPRLFYPRHHHPAEEMYLVIAGEAVFMRDGHPDETLRAGDSVLHQSNQPHAMETKEHPVLALVVWRNGFDTPPVLTPEAPQ